MLGIFQVSGGGIENEGRSTDPRVAVDFSEDYFVVIWEYDCWGDGTDLDIHAVTYNVESGYLSSPVAIAETTDDEINPDLACNFWTGRCLVVWENDNTGIIEGQHLQVNFNMPPTPYQTSFQISTVSACGDPFIAWNIHQGRYLVVYTSNVYGIHQAVGCFQHVYDVYQPSGDQYTEGSQLLHGSPSGNPDYSPYYPTSLAFDPCTESFIITYTWRTEDDSDVKLTIVPAIGTSGIHLPDVANGFLYEDSAVIDHISTPMNYTCGEMDKLVLAYTRQSDYGVEGGILTVDLIGNNNPGAPEYTIPNVNEHTFIVESSSYAIQYKPSIAGSGVDGEFFISFTNIRDEELHYSYDVLGQILNAAPRDTEHLNFIPLLTR